MHNKHIPVLNKWQWTIMTGRAQMWKIYRYDIYSCIVAHGWSSCWPVGRADRPCPTAKTHVHIYRAWLVMTEDDRSRPFLTSRSTAIHVRKSCYYYRSSVIFGHDQPWLEITKMSNPATGWGICYEIEIIGQSGSWSVRTGHDRSWIEIIWQSSPGQKCDRSCQVMTGHDRAKHNLLLIFGHGRSYDSIHFRSSSWLKSWPWPTDNDVGMPMTGYDLWPNDVWTLQNDASVRKKAIETTTTTSKYISYGVMKIFEVRVSDL